MEYYLAMRKNALLTCVTAYINLPAIMLLYSKGNNYQNEKAIYRIEENVCNLYISLGINLQNM